MGTHKPRMSGAMSRGSNINLLDKNSLGVKTTHRRDLLSQQRSCTRGRTERGKPDWEPIPLSFKTISLFSLKSDLKLGVIVSIYLNRKSVILPPPPSHN